MLTNPTLPLPRNAVLDEPATARRLEAVVSEAVKPVDPEAIAEPSFRNTAIGIVAGMTIALGLAVWIPMWLFLDELWGGLGVAAFVTFWGGPGFGVMTAGTVWASRRATAGIH